MLEIGILSLTWCNLPACLPAGFADGDGQMVPGQSHWMPIRGGFLLAFSPAAVSQTLERMEKYAARSQKMLLDPAQNGVGEDDNKEPDVLWIHWDLLNRAGKEGEWDLFGARLSSSLYKFK